MTPAGQLTDPADMLFAGFAARRGEQLLFLNQKTFARHRIDQAAQTGPSVIVASQHDPAGDSQLQKLMGVYKSAILSHVEFASSKTQLCTHCCIILSG